MFRGYLYVKAVLPDCLIGKVKILRNWSCRYYVFFPHSFLYVARFVPTKQDRAQDICQTVSTYWEYNGFLRILETGFSNYFLAGWVMQLSDYITLAGHCKLSAWCVGKNMCIEISLQVQNLDCLYSVPLYLIVQCGPANTEPTCGFVFVPTGVL